MGDIGLAAAFSAGLLSFVSPCVLPLVPAYLCFLGGVSLDQLTENGQDANRGRVMGAAFSFVIGFSLVFVALGASASALGGLVAEHLTWLSVVAGLLIVLLGIHMSGLFRFSFLNYEKRMHVNHAPAGPVGAFVVGLAFAFGWTPCVGPVLASILMMAAGRDSLNDGTLLLSAYAAGLGIPFLLSALATRPFMAAAKRLKKHMRILELSTGALLVVTGVLILSGRMADVGEWLQEAVPALTSAG